MIRGKSHSGSIYLFLFSFIELLVSMVLSNKSFSFSEVRSFQEIKAISCKTRGQPSQASELEDQVLRFKRLLCMLFDVWPLRQTEKKENCMLKKKKRERRKKFSAHSFHCCDWSTWQH